MKREKDIEPSALRKPFHREMGGTDRQVWRANRRFAPLLA
jgi:hypothetical protein